jgi:hypothetical protein
VLTFTFRHHHHHSPPLTPPTPQHLSTQQEEYITAQRLSIRFNPTRRMQPPALGMRRGLFHAVTHEAFELFILACIVINSVVMAAQYFGQVIDWLIGSDWFITPFLRITQLF